MISHSCEKVSWTPVTKKVWSSNLKKLVDYSFLHWNLSNNYNFEMSNNNIADQLWLVYLIMWFQRNNKWWWALFLWGYKASLVNLYVAMKRYYELKGVPVKWTHHNWNEAIAYADINPNEYWPRAKSPPKIVDLNVTVAKGRSHKMDSLALSPTRGQLRGRLNGSMTHMPVLPDALGLIIDTNRLTIAIPAKYLQEVLDLLNSTWHPNRCCFKVSEVQTLTGKLAHLAKGANWVFHLLSYLYSSIAYALSENKRLLTESSAEFQDIVLAIQTNVFITPCKNLARHTSFAMKCAAKLTHHASYQYNINKTMRYKIEFFRNKLKPD
jgi:hypothetical protein